MPRWRKATWAIIIFSGVMLFWVVSGVGAVADNCAGRTGQDLELCQAGTAIGGGIGVTFIFMIWVLGFLILAVIWFMSRPANNVILYGPQGQQVQVSEKEAARRVSKGWTYQPPGKNTPSANDGHPDA